ncbi:MAG: CHAT domain-containing protein, partial [Leptodesmis sp.]|uniref:CHAT domain-containing protein n=1 Tax=Leptodesmis sp. TaxID=3100501 RepID=UPI003D09ACD1
DPRKLRTTSYLPQAQQLYQWLVAPVKAELQARQINNLVFLMDTGLRSLPVAALQDGQKFLIEDYSVGLMPSLSLTDTRYRDIRDAKLLTLGISESTQGQPPLPSVLVEVSTLVQQIWSGTSFLNENATLETLKTARQNRPYGIIHLATHANFLPGKVNNSYIQLWDDRLRLDQIRQLGWNDPQVELLVLSACDTALGDREAELGFGGLAVQSGVKTALASLWAVNDAATAALITRFYKDLRTAPIKAEALRQAQLAMLRGEVYIENKQIRGVAPTGIPLPADVTGLRDTQLSHPYYWSAFTMIGNPW